MVKVLFLSIQNIAMDYCPRHDDLHFRLNGILKAKSPHLLVFFVIDR